MCQGKAELIGCIPKEEIPEIIRRWFKKATIILSVECSIEYEGRATSTASKARRLIIIKEDGTVIVHGPTGRNPINWQPKAYVRGIIKDGEILIECIRLNPKEYLRIHLEGDPDIMIVPLSRGLFRLSGSESDIVNELYRHPEIVEEGARVVSREVSTPYGRIDLVLKGKDEVLLLVEVKRGRADVEAVFQLKRYVEYYRKLGIDCRGVLVASGFTGRAVKALKEHGFKHIKFHRSVG